MPFKTPRLSRCRVNLAKKPSTAPGGRGRGEAEMEPGVAFEPGADLGVLVRRVVVDDQMQFPPGRRLAVDRVEESDEFLMPVAGHVLADDTALQYVEGDEQRRRAVRLVVMGHRPAAAPLHLQLRLGAVERLDLRFLIDRQHQHVLTSRPAAASRPTRRR